MIDITLGKQTSGAQLQSSQVKAKAEVKVKVKWDRRRSNKQTAGI